MVSEWENRECSIVIAGSGVFGLATALELSIRPSFSKASITVVDRSFPYPDAASIDRCRIIRTDYKEPLYHALANEAQKYWRGQDDPQISPFRGVLGKRANYTESRLIEAANTGDVNGLGIIDRILREWDILGALGVWMRGLPNNDTIRGESGLDGIKGERGYILENAGWVDAEAGTRFLREIVELQKREDGVTPRVVFREAEVTDLNSSMENDEMHVRGVTLSGGETISADLTILALGVWTRDFRFPTNNLEPIGTATAYIKLSEEQKARFQNTPTICNLTHGVSASFLDDFLKVSRYAPDEGDQSVPFITGPYDPNLTISDGDREILRSGLHDITPAFDDCELSGRVCWNTASGNFIVAYPPKTTGLFVAAGGHVYKFLPVVGREVVDIITRNPLARFKTLWCDCDGLGPKSLATGLGTERHEAEHEECLAAWKLRLLNSVTPGDFCVC